MPKPLNVLIVEDNSSDAELSLIELRKAGYQPTWHVVCTEKEYLHYLKPTLDMILSDYSLPQFSGLQALLLRNESGYDIPFVIISGTIGEELGVECMRQGADDYLMKDRLGRLGVAIDNALNKKVLRDEKKQLDETLRESEERYRHLIQSANDWIWEVDQNGIYTYVSSQSREMLGYEPAELIGKSPFDLMPPEEAERVGSLYQAYIKERKSFRRLENINLHKDGHPVVLETNGAAIFETNGNFSGYRGMDRDITERVRAEKLLNALNMASVAMGTALTPQEIFIVVAKVLNVLDITSTLFLLDETKSRLLPSYFSFQQKTVKKIEKLTGVDQQSFTFLVDAVDVYRRVVRDKETVFNGNPEQVIHQMLPKGAIMFAPKIVDLLHIQKGIFAPLIVEDQVIGVFSIQSNSLSVDNVPATSAFAHQLAGAWYKSKLLQDLIKTVEGTVRAIAATSELRDPYTSGHQAHVSDLATAIATEMHLANGQVESIRMASLVHDLGKIKVPSEILSKPGRLNDLEFNLIKAHPQDGFDLLKNIEFPWPLAQIVLQHHEKMDGSGYPKGLKGDEILIEARVLSVADIVEAMSSHRPYRPALGIEKALEQIKLDRGTLLDPDVVDACLKIFKEGYKLTEN